MKCINCGNEVQDGLTTCPYCNNVIQNNGVPATPAAPVLPQDQGMVVTPQTEVPAPGIVAETVAVEAKPEVAPTPTPVAPPVPPVTPVTPAAPVMPEAPVPGEVVGGEKIGNSAPVIPKKKGKAKLIIIILLILLVLAGVGIFFYMYEFKSADKRIDVITQHLFNFTTKVKNSDVQLSSGKYEITGKVGTKDESISIDLNGTYGVDLKNKLIDYTINLKSLKSPEELLPSPLNLELYVNDNKMYVLLQNFFSDYIYTESDEIAQIFDATSKNDINYVNIINSVKKAINNGVKATNIEQTVETVTINGKSQKANVLRLKLTAANQNAFMKSVLRTLANDKNFVKEIAAITEDDEEEIIKSMKEAIDDIKYEKDLNSVIEFYSPLIGDSFLGIKYTDKDEDGKPFEVEVYPITNGYGVSVTSDSKSIVKGKYTTTVKKTSKTEETSMKLDFSIFVDDVTYNLDLSINISEDVNPKVEKVNVKNSVNVSNLTEDNIKTIMDNIGNYGEIGMMLESYLETLLPSEDDDFGFGMEEPIDNCSPGLNCIGDVTDVY